MSRGVDTVGVPVALLRSQIQDSGFAHIPSSIDASAIGVSIAAHATPHTEGAWVELIAATTAPATWILVSPSDTRVGAADTSMLLDIGVGAAAAEVPIINNIPVGFLAVAAVVTIPGPSFLCRFPIRVAKGTRISARCQALITVDTVLVTAWTAAVAGVAVGADPGNLTIDTYGADPATSTGTMMPTSDTYVEITAATTQPYRALILMPAASGAVHSTSEVSTYTLAVGASGGEIAIGTLQVQDGTNEAIAALPSLSHLVARHVPKGTRIACKQSTGHAWRGAVVFGIPYA